MDGARELLAGGSAAPVVPCQQAKEESACSKRATCAPALPDEPATLREAFSQTGGRVVVETDDEVDSPPLGLSVNRPDSPCLPPLGIIVSGLAMKQKEGSGSLQQTLSSLWNELEAAHRGAVEPAGSSCEPSLSCAPELATLDFSLSSPDTLESGLAGCSVNFFKSAHACASATTEKFDEHRKDEPSTAGEGEGREKQAKKERKTLYGIHKGEFQQSNCQPQTDVPQGPADSASVVSEMISRLKENMSEQAEGWWRMSMMRVANMPLLASYETSTKDVNSRTSEIQDELAPGPNENSVFSSNWHDRLQWTFQQVLTLRESQESRPASQLRRMLFDRELALSHEIGSFAAAARAAAVVLIHSLAMEDGCSTRQRFRASVVERQVRKGPAQCFIRITPEDYPTVWSIYQPKFACGKRSVMDLSLEMQQVRTAASCTLINCLLHCVRTDQLYVFDSLIFTVILGDPQANIYSYASKEVYQNDIKGRQAMADAVYASCLSRKQQTDLIIRGNTRFKDDRRDHFGQQVDTVWNTHGQAKFERTKLGLPIACLVDYAGFAVLVEPLLPLNPAPVNVLEELEADIRSCLPDFAKQCESIGNLLACFDALDKVDRATYNKFKNIARFLNLADYPFARGASDFELPLPHAALWRSQVDHFCIFRNLHEMLPPKNKGFDRHLSLESLTWHCPALAGNSTGQQRLAAHSLELAIKQDLVPVINGLQKNFLDSLDISHTLHAHGVNLRNVADLLNHGPASPFRDAIVREVVARSAKRLFRMQVARLSRGKLEETTHMEEIQRLVVTLFNLVLSTDEESRMFWLHQIFPLALERYKVDLTEVTSPESVCTYSLFKAMEYNLGVQFDNRVAVRSANGSGEATLELRLPLTVADLSTFSSSRECLLFPHVSYVRAALLGNDQAEASARDAEAAEAHVARLRSTKWRMRHFLESDGTDKAFQERHKSTTADAAGELHTFAELREVRGFYPKVATVVPNTFALMQAAASSTVAGASSFSLDVLLENMKAGIDILLLGKILQQTAYIMLQHNEVKAAASIADYIYSKIPDGLSLHSEAMLLDMQCTTKGSERRLQCSSTL
ncbi:hypothetical protein Emag_000128 [Eimeria magna]